MTLAEQGHWPEVAPVGAGLSMGSEREPEPEEGPSDGLTVDEHLAALVADEAAAEPSTARVPLRDRILSRARLADLPQPEPLIADTLDQRTVALLSGRRSSGKSFIALDWACCIATGKPWQGREISGTGPVLYIAAEGAHGLEQRVAAWEYAWHHKATALDVLPLPVNLFKGGPLVLELVAHVAAQQYRLVVVDTWARSTVGGKENDNTDSTIAFERLDALRRTGPSVLVVAHTDAGDTKTRGATALEDNVDTVYRVKGDPGYLELYRDKRKDGPTEDKHQLQLQTITLPSSTDDAWPTTSCVVQNTRGQGEPVSGRTADVLSIFDSTFLDTGCTKKELRDACTEGGITSSGVLFRALTTLLRTQVLVNTGTDTRPFYKPGTAHA